MVVKVRFAYGPVVRPGRTKNQRLALGFAALLVPAIVTAWSLAAWRLASDLGFAGKFGIEAGLFAHWQPWIGVALALHTVAGMLNRYGERMAGTHPKLK